MSKAHSVESIIEEWKKELPFFEGSLKELFQKSYFTNKLFEPNLNKELTKGSDRLGEAIRYSLFTGGKRFRPLLTFASCKALSKSFKEALHWAMAIECIHTYSLIHDDLPSMDNDDERRGLPTVHKKYDEATALLAGDALFTEAFSILAQAYSKNINLASLIQLLSTRSGFQGMVSGQANDLFFTQKDLSEDNLQKKFLPTEDQVLFVHLQKTAALINAACTGPFLIFNQDQELIEKLNHFGLVLGILFQLKDDFLDANDKVENNMVQSMGADQSHNIYQKYKQQAESLIDEMPSSLNLKPYLDLINYNENRAL